MVISNRCRCLAGLLGTFLLTGCTISADWLVLQSKFSYPNGDYAPLGHVTAEQKYTTFFSAKEMDREIFLALEQAALATRPGADMMVDYLISTDVTVPILPIVMFTTFRVEGTALRFRELGSQQFRDRAIAPPARTE